MAKIVIDTDEILKTIKGYLPDETDAKVAEAKEKVVELFNKAKDKGIETYEQIIKALDTDGDGKISDAEFKAKAGELAEKYHIPVDKIKEICKKYFPSK